MNNPYELDIKSHVLNKVEKALKKQIDEVDYGGGNWGMPIGGGYFSKDDPEEEDVPNVSSGSYKTNYVMGSDLIEQEDEEDESGENVEGGLPSDLGGAEEDSEDEEDISYENYYDPHTIGSELSEQEDEEDESGENVEGGLPPEQGGAEPEGDTEMGGEEMGGEDMEMGAGAMPEVEIKDPKELGRTYELKKIYNRLTAIESYLLSSTDPKLIKLKNYISRSIELFELLAANLKSYKDQIDEYIVRFYNFINIIYSVLAKYYKEKKRKYR